MDWQPIETAPKDGTPIIIMNMPDDMSGEDYIEYGPDSCMVAHWAGSGPDENWYLHGFPMVDANFGKNYWSGDGMFTNNGYLGLDPTHWMPLPPPPKA